MTDTQATRVDIVMPDLGVAEVRVTVWYAMLGDRVYQGDRLVEVSVAGATIDVPAPATGHLLDQVVFARDVLRPGQLLGTLVADPE